MIRIHQLRHNPLAPWLVTARRRPVLLMRQADGAWTWLVMDLGGRILGAVPRSFCEPNPKPWPKDAEQAMAWPRRDLPDQALIVQALIVPDPRGLTTPRLEYR